MNPQDINIEKTCPKFNRELYKHFNIYIKPQGRLNFPKKNSPVDFVYNKEKNYSHSDVFDSADVDEALFSETKLKYKIPNSSLIKAKDGIRKQMMEKFLWKQMAREVIDELIDKNQIENYCSEYENNYYKDGFSTTDLELVANEEDHIKYPLYGAASEALTFYSYAKHNEKNILHPFKRTSVISKPLDQRLDSEWN